MAGEVVSKTINNWILDYTCNKVWDEFNSSKDISDNTITLVQCVLSEPVDTSHFPQQSIHAKQLFLKILIRLKGGDEPVRDEGGEEETVLEQMLKHFIEFLELSISREEAVQKEGEELINDIKSEAVLVCCRKGNFDLGQHVLNRVFPKKGCKNKSDNQMTEILTLLIEKGDPKDQLLGPYVNFIGSILDYLQKLFTTFEPPLLIQAAKILLEDTEKSNKRIKMDVINQSKTVAENESNNIESRLNLVRDEKRMKKLHNANLTEMFGSPSPEKRPKLKTRTLSSEEPSSSTDHRDTSKTSTPDRVTASPMLPPTTTPTKAGDASSLNRKNLGRHNRHAQALPDSPSAKYKGSPSGKNKHTVRPGTPCRSLATSSSRGQFMSLDDNEESGDEYRPGTNTESDSDNDSVVSMVTVSNTDRKKWTEEEMSEFYSAVKMFGVGKWAQIRKHLDTSRSGVMLKDKWRNMVNKGDVGRLEAKKKNRKQSLDGGQ